MDEQPFRDLLQRMDALHSDPVMVERGEILFRQGDPGDSFFLVKTGRVRVIHNLGLPNERVLGEVGSGEPAGELALLWSSTRSATVVAVRFTVLARVSKAEFDELLHEFPAEAMELMRVVAWRLKQSYEAPPARSALANIAVVPLSAEVPLTEICSCLTNVVASAGKAKSWRSADVPPSITVRAQSEKTESIHSRNHALARWLSKQTDRAAANIWFAT